MKELEDRLYRSYLKAEAHQDYNAPDKEKRHPELTAPVIQKAAVHHRNILVTGSKGKGSVSHYIAFILEQFEKTGLFTSPHILQMRERIRVNHRMIEEETYDMLLEETTEYYLKLDQTLPENVGISPIGILCTMALRYFAMENTTVNVLEYGKGVAYDDVNAVPREIGVIQPIFLEHQRELGRTIEEIAKNKAEIIQSGMKAVFTAKQIPEVMAILREKAHSEKVPLYEIDKDFQITYCEKEEETGKYTIRVAFADGKETGMVKVPMPGRWQADNFALAIGVTGYFLGEEKLLSLLEDQAFQNRLSELTIPGRLQCLREQPLVLMDACINGASAKYLAREYGGKKFLVVVVVPADKDYVGVCREICPIANAIILSKTDNPHYHFSEKQTLEVEKLDCVREAKIPVSYEGDLDSIFNHSLSTKEPMMLLGSTTMISAYAEWKGRRHE